MTPARDRYPNLDALARGTVSGHLAEWPLLKLEASSVLEEVERLGRSVERRDYAAGVGCLLALITAVWITAWGLVMVMEATNPGPPIPKTRVWRVPQ